MSSATLDKLAVATFNLVSNERNLIVYAIHKVAVVNGREIQLKDLAPEDRNALFSFIGSVERELYEGRK